MATANSPLLSRDHIKSCFDHLTHVSNAPTYDEIYNLRRQIREGAAQIQSRNGGGEYGHMAITMTAAEYATVSETPWEAPQAPPQIFEVPAGTNALNERNQRENHQQRCNIFYNQLNAEKVIKEKIKEVVPRDLIVDLINHFTGIIHHTIPEILAHLFNLTSAQPDITDLENRRETIEKEKYQLDEELTTYFRKLEYYKDYADAARDPMTHRNLINHASRHFKATGHFTKSIRAWNNRAPDQQTWVQFKNYMHTERNKVLQEIKDQKGTRQYHANQIVHENQRIYTKMDQLEATINQVLQQQTNPPVQQQPYPAFHIDGQPMHPMEFPYPPAPHTAFQPMAPPQPPVMPQLPQPMYAAVQAQLTQQQQQWQAQMQQQMQQQVKQQLEALQAERQKETIPAGPRRGRRWRWIPNKNYCWTHGWRVTKEHTSQTCKFPAAGHQRQATRANTMGGSDQGKKEALAAGT